MTGDWISSVEEHRDVLESWADSELPLSEDISELLDIADGRSHWRGDDERKTGIPPAPPGGNSGERGTDRE